MSVGQEHEPIKIAKTIKNEIIKGPSTAEADVDLCSVAANVLCGYVTSYKLRLFILVFVIKCFFFAFT